MKLRGAIIGFGEVARNGHWPGYAANDDVEIVAVVDRTPARRELAESLQPGISTYASLADVPRRAPIDFVDICTPPALHGEPMLDAIGRGWHVLCEKPFLLDAAALGEARARATAANVAVIPVHNWKYAPIVQAATAALRSGAIGSLTRVEIETSRLKAAPTAEHAGVNWRRDPAIAGGGILMDHGWHSVYIALHWFTEHATGVSARLHWPSGEGLVAEDEARVTIDFPSGSAAIVLTWNGTVRRNAMRLEGTRGEIVAADDTLTVRGEAEKTMRFPSALSAGSAHADWFEAMLPDVIAGFRNPPQSRAVFEEAAQTLAIIQQAYATDPALAGTAAKG
jgi:predicted dehydrogenase